MKKVEQKIWTQICKGWTTAKSSFSSHFIRSQFVPGEEHHNYSCRFVLNFKVFVKVQYSSCKSIDLKLSFQLFESLVLNLVYNTSSILSTDTKRSNNLQGSSHLWIRHVSSALRRYRSRSLSSVLSHQADVSNCLHTSIQTNTSNTAATRVRLLWKQLTLTAPIELE